MSKKATTSHANSAGVIEPQILYRLDEAMKRAGWGRKAFDAARRRGLRTLRSGKRVYVKGCDLLGFIESDSAKHSPPEDQAR